MPFPLYWGDSYYLWSLIHLLKFYKAMVKSVSLQRVYYTRHYLDPVAFKHERKGPVPQ